MYFPFNLTTFSGHLIQSSEAQMGALMHHKILSSTDFGNTSWLRQEAVTDYKGENCSWQVNAHLSAEEDLRRTSDATFP